MGIIDWLIKGIVRITPRRLKHIILEEYKYLPFGNISYSQEGEDLILCRLFNEKNSGFYIDIGAHHPIRFSNTYKFYLMGWNGINIDAAPGSMVPFREIRDRDINIEAALSNEKKDLQYYVFNEPALNTLSRETAEGKAKIPGYYIKEVISLRTETINDILARNITEDKVIDFLTIDIEGMDIIVLKSLNFRKYQPLAILIEIKDFNIYENSDLIIFMNENNYNFYAKTVNTIFFRRDYKLYLPKNNAC